MASIKTSFLIMSDTHGLENKPEDWPLRSVDVAVHCGDLTEDSKIEEFRSSLDLLRHTKADLKLVIAGNHDFTLDTPTFRSKIHIATPLLDMDLVRREFGDFGQTRQMFESEEVKSADIMFLEEGTHSFVLKNGARLTVYASPWTPSSATVMSEHRWGFQYVSWEGERMFENGKIGNEVDLVMTHGPPMGIMDYTDARRRAGCPSLFAAVARARPRLHCFGHIHEGWGAKLVSWKDPVLEKPSFMTDIDNDQSSVLEKLATIKPRKFDTEDMLKEKADKEQRYREQRFCSTSHCKENSNALNDGQQTLFVNASIESIEEDRLQLPWIVDLDLNKATP